MVAVILTKRLKIFAFDPKFEPVLMISWQQQGIQQQLQHQPQQPQPQPQQ